VTCGAVSFSRDGGLQGNDQNTRVAACLSANFSLACPTFSESSCNEVQREMPRGPTGRSKTLRGRRNDCAASAGSPQTGWALSSRPPSLRPPYS